jgi:PmbA protein
MQRDYWYSSARDAREMQSAALVGKVAGERTLRRLGSQAMKTGQYPVLFEAPLASGILSSLISAISGGNLYRKSSFLLRQFRQVDCKSFAQHLRRSMD